MLPRRRGRPPGAPDRPETGTAGDVPLVDQITGRAAEGYSCGLSLVGYSSLGGRGGNANMAWSGDCAYVTGDGVAELKARLAALMHDVGKPRTRKFLDDGTVTFHHHDVVGAKLTRKRMKALRFSNDEIDAVTKLVELHLRFHGYGSGEWTDSAVRRYVRDAGDELERLHMLTRADCTTRNQRKADRLRRTYDDLEERIARLSEEEELASIRPDLDGNQIMEILGIGPGREVGEAYHHLLELRMDHGPLGEERATDELRAWWAARPAD